MEKSRTSLRIATFLHAYPGSGTQTVASDLGLSFIEARDWLNDMARGSIPVVRAFDAPPRWEATEAWAEEWEVDDARL